VKWGLLFAFILNIDGGLLELTLEPYLFLTLGVPIQAFIQDLFYISLLGTAIAILGFFFIDKVNKTRLLIIIAGIYMIPLGLLAYFTMTATLTYTLFLWLYGVFSLVSGLSFVTYVALFFDLSAPKVAGTMIALFLTLNNAGRLFGIMISGFFTISWIYIIALGLTAFRILPLWKIRMADVENAFYKRPQRPFKWLDILIAGIPLAVITVIVILRFL
jgi:MFS family permease